MSATWLTHLQQQWHSLAWRPWLEALSKTHTLLRYDPRGCGLSERHATDISFETWISDFEAVIDAAGFDRHITKPAEPGVLESLIASAAGAR